MTEELPPPGGEIGSVGRRLADLQIVRGADWREAVAKAGQGADFRKILKALHLTTRRWPGCQTPAPLVTLFMAREILAGVADPSRIERLRFKHYVLRDRLGAGGFGEVFQVLNLNIDKIQAMTRILPHRLAAGSTEFLKRFRIEAKANARLESIGVPQIRETEFDTPT
ncbi:MAG: hypothetical protein ACRDD1_16930, partial [Planctomycetia bacterium]